MAWRKHWPQRPPPPIVTPRVPSRESRPLLRLPPTPPPMAAAARTPSPRRPSGPLPRATNMGPGTSTVGPLHRIDCPPSRLPRAVQARPPPPRRSTPSSTALLGWTIPRPPQETFSHCWMPLPQPGRRSRSKISSITCNSSAASPRSPPAPTLAQAPMGPITRAV